MLRAMAFPIWRNRQFGNSSPCLQLTPTKRSDIDYAMIHPTMTLVKILAAQVTTVFLSS
jgi:hypothetical protein